MRAFGIGTSGLALALVLAVAGPVLAQSEISGIEVGAPTLSIPVLDVTGEYRGKPICYVCEFQDAPNVLAFFRETGDDTAALIRQLNTLYVENKDRGFKAVAMIIAGEDAVEWLEALNAAEGFEIPLTVFRRGPRDVAARLYELNLDVPNTFFVTRNRFVEANIAAITPAEFGRVAAATSAMLSSVD